MHVRLCTTIFTSIHSKIACYLFLFALFMYAYSNHHKGQKTTEIIQLWREEWIIDQRQEYSRVHYFLNIIDTTLVSFKSRSESYANHQNIFGFLYMNAIGNLDYKYLLKYSQVLHLHFIDFYGTEMFKEFKMFRSITQINYSALDWMNYIVKNNLSEA